MAVVEFTKTDVPLFGESTGPTTTDQIASSASALRLMIAFGEVDDQRAALRELEELYARLPEDVVWRIKMSPL